MSQRKRAIREAFRADVFKRDGYKCQMCGKPGYDRQGTIKEGKVPLDAHHIQNPDRSEDYYVKENGITVCDNCHLKAEKFHISGEKEWEEGFHPNDLYAKIQSSWRM